MTVQLPERVEPETLNLEEFEVDIVCENHSLQNDPGWEAGHICHGDSARWVAWRANCCPQSPRFRLICDSCRKVYLAWRAKDAYVTCISCGAETGGFISFTPLEGKS